MKMRCGRDAMRMTVMMRTWLMMGRSCYQVDGWIGILQFLDSCIPLQNAFFSTIGTATFVAKTYLSGCAVTSGTPNVMLTGSTRVFFNKTSAWSDLQEMQRRLTELWQTKMTATWRRTDQGCTCDYAELAALWAALSRFLCPFLGGCTGCSINCALCCTLLHSALAVTWSPARAGVSSAKYREQWRSRTGDSFHCCLMVSPPCVPVWCAHQHMHIMDMWHMLGWKRFMYNQSKRRLRETWEVRVQKFSRLFNSLKGCWMWDPCSFLPCVCMDVADESGYWSLDFLGGAHWDYLSLQCLQSTHARHQTLTFTSAFQRAFLGCFWNSLLLWHGSVWNVKSCLHLHVMNVTKMQLLFGNAKNSDCLYFSMRSTATSGYQKCPLCHWETDCHILLI